MDREAVVTALLVGLSGVMCGALAAAAFRRWQKHRRAQETCDKIDVMLAEMTEKVASLEERYAEEVAESGSGSLREEHADG